MQVGQHVETAICPGALPLRHARGHFTSQSLQMHLPVGVLLEALMPYYQHYYHN